MRDQPDDVTIIAYDVSNFALLRWFEDHLESRPLCNAHQVYDVDVSNFVPLVQKARLTCEAFIDDLTASVDQLLAEYVEPRIGRVRARQARPTVRVHFRVGDAILESERSAYSSFSKSRFLEEYYFSNGRKGAFHRDCDYRVPLNAMNVWVPLTTCFGTNTLWIGSDEHEGRDAHPLSLDYGELAIFRGSSRWHGVVWNTAAPTRVSFDLRVIADQT